MAMLFNYLKRAGAAAALAATAAPETTAQTICKIEFAQARTFRLLPSVLWADSAAHQQQSQSPKQSQQN
jgi:hypothetical protein